MSLKTCKIKYGTHYLWARKNNLGGEEFLPCYYYYNMEVEVIEETSSSVIVKFNDIDFLKFRKTDIYDLKTINE